MADIELTTVPVETSVDVADELYFNDVSETPDAINRVTVANFFGTALASLRSVFTAASSSAPASLQLHEDTDNGSNKITVTAPASVASDKTFTLPDVTGTAVVGSLGSTDNAILRADGTGGSTGQASNAVIDDTGTGFFKPSNAFYTGIIVASVDFPTTGITADTNGVTLMRGGVSEFSAFNNVMAVRRDTPINWCSLNTGTADAVADTGLARHSAGVIKATDGTTGIKAFLGGGATVASATALPLPTGRVFHVSGTTTITSITSTNFASGAVITLIFDGILTFTAGNNLKLAGNFVTTANDTITLVYDGTNWHESSRVVVTN